MARDVTWTAAHVTDLLFAFEFGCDAGQQLSIERLVLKLSENAAGIFVCDAIVGSRMGLNCFLSSYRGL